MITQAHVMIYSTAADADRAVLTDVLGIPATEAYGWVTLHLPTTEAAFHPAAEYRHALYLMCDDLDATIARLTAAGYACSPPAPQAWGRSTMVRLPGGGDLGVYEPHHG